jgi:hypothetical protein
MKRFLFFVFLLFFSLKSFSQVINYYSVDGIKFGYYNEKQDEYIDEKRFKKVDLQISRHDNRIRIHSLIPKEYYYVKFVGEYNDTLKNEKLIVLVTYDSDGKICYLSFKECLKESFIIIQYEKNKIIFRIRYLS